MRRLTRFLGELWKRYKGEKNVAVNICPLTQLGIVSAQNCHAGDCSGGGARAHLRTNRCSLSSATGVTFRLLRANLVL